MKNLKLDELSKGQVLLGLQDKVRISKIPKTLIFTVEFWIRDKKKALFQINNFFRNINFLAIRSSSMNEDNKKFSQAGKYHSELFVEQKNKKKIIKSINKVISKYEKKNLKKNHIILQQMIIKPDISGVIFTKEPNTNAPYYVINYDDMSGLTNTVTSGNSEYSNKSLNIYREKLEKINSPRFKKLIKSINELEKIFDLNELDVEFCIKGLHIYILQVRRLTNLKKWKKSKKKSLRLTLSNIEKTIKLKMKKTKGVIGHGNVFGQMPDWNPAEIIGLYPKPLAYSLYKKLITDKTWSIARKKMGYKRPADTSLMINLGGLPYINTKLSFNSFLPKNIKTKTSEKIVDHWLEKLKLNPQLHDKIESEIAVTCFRFDINKKIELLLKKQLNFSEKFLFIERHVQLFRLILDKNNPGSLDYNLNLLNILKKKKIIKNYSSNIKNLINDCIKYGTIPFSILARHAFIAISILESLKNLKIISRKNINEFNFNLSTITTEFIKDVENLRLKKLSRKKFNYLYGHLRPGTYDILSKRYDETNYINYSKTNKKNIKIKKSEIFTDYQKNKISELLKKFDIKISSNELINYLNKAISSREYAKFIFTRNVSEILKTIKNNFIKKKFKVQDIAFLKLNECIKNQSKKDISKIRDKILVNKKKYIISRSIKLPQLIYDVKGAYIAPFQMNLPNYISNKIIRGELVNLLLSKTKKINNKIVLIENADPGYDWIFTYKIKGLITKYGGVNSHMAIRCREFNLPAAIGCGPQLYDKIENSKNIILDCSINKIEI
tara:strand:+ start:3083 stop:5425 length:2343 start_codon:yes stop_codon:yes gene_type:complete